LRARVRARANADRGRVLHLQEHFKEALAAYDAALEADPKRVAVRRWRGEVLLVLGKYSKAKEALAAYGAAAAAFDDYLKQGGTPSAALYRQRGFARGQLDQHLEAIDDYSRALDAEPKKEEKAPLYLERGKEYLIVKAPQPALRDFTKALQHDPKSGDAYLGCAYAWVKLGDAQKAMTNADQAVECQKNEPRLWLGAARVYTQAGEMIKPNPGQEANQATARAQLQDKAVEFLDTALKLVPPDQQADWREQVMNDPALSPLHTHPRFPKITPRDKGGP